MCIFLFCHRLHTKELRLTNISESIISGSSVSTLPYYSVSISDELNTLRDDELETGNISSLSISDDDLIMDIFVIMAL